MRFVCPLVVVRDIPRSTAFYRDLLAQKIKLDFGENVTFEGDFSIHLETHFRALLGEESRPVSYGSHSSELYFESEDLDGIHDRLVRHGVEFIHHIVEQPWKQRAMRFYDPDHHVIEVGETLGSLVQRLSRAGFSTAQIHQATSLPIEFIGSVAT